MQKYNICIKPTASKIKYTHPMSLKIHLLTEESKKHISMLMNQKTKEKGCTLKYNLS